MDTHNFFDEAVRYYSLGFNVTCVLNKKNEFNKSDRNLLKAPAHEWASLRNRRQNFEEFEEYSWDKSVGIGVVLGYNGLMAIDIDGCIEEKFISWICEEIGVPNNYNWIIRTGSSAGYHVILYCLDRPYIENYLGWSFSTFGGVDEKGESLNAYYPKSTLDQIEGPYYDGGLEPYYISRSGGYKQEIYKDHFSDKFLLTDLFQKIEFRWSNHLVLPPSIHKSGKRYEFINGIPDVAPMTIPFKTLHELQKKICLAEAEFSGWEGTADQHIAFEDGISFQQAKQKYKGHYNPEYMVLDIETDGLPVKTISRGFIEYEFPEIVQISWLIVDNSGNLLMNQSSIVKPEGYNISDESIKIHGINNELAISLGKSLKSTLKNLLDDVAKVNRVVCHNYEFDSQILIHHMRKKGLDYELFEKKPSFCTMESSMKYFNFGYGNKNKYPKLSELYSALFGKSKSVEHNGIYDCIMTKICYQKLKSYIA